MNKHSITTNITWQYFLIIVSYILCTSSHAELTSPDYCHENCAITTDVFGENILEEETQAISLYLDNDILTGGAKDEDYTGGFALSFSGTNAKNHPFSIDSSLNSINELLSINKLFDKSDFTLHSCEVGLTAFTPSDINSIQPIENDRPYSSLIYMANTQQKIQQSSRLAWISTLTIGALGLSLSGDLQNSIHAAIGSTETQGWDNQISDGGEFTFRYSITRQQYHSTNSDKFHFTSAAKLSVGYITEATYGGSIRWGKLRTPWWSFNSDSGKYGDKANVELPTTCYVDEFYFLAGANIKLRAYNAFLQGQFRDSQVSYSASDVEPLVYEGWIGISCAFRSGYRLSYILRRQSNELKVGSGRRAFSYGGLIMSYGF